MIDFFEIAGTLIRYSEIEDFRIIDAEYIYRPSYTIEEVPGLLGVIGTKTRYVFNEMQPYAAIIDEKGSYTKTGKVKAGNFKEAFKVDIFEDVRTTIGDKFNIKSIRSKKYTCMTKNRRIFTTYLEDVPALLQRSPGQYSDVKKNDELYPLLGEPIAPAIGEVPALQIRTIKEEFIFYGYNIHLNNVEEEFHRLKYEMNQYSNRIQLIENKGAPKRGILGKVPKLSLPRQKHDELECNNEGGIKTDMAKLKRALDEGILTKQEYDVKLGEILDRWEKQ